MSRFKLHTREVISAILAVLLCACTCVACLGASKYAQADVSSPTITFPYRHYYYTSDPTGDDRFQYSMTPMNIDREAGTATPIPIAPGQPVPEGLTREGDVRYIWELKGDCAGNLVYAMAGVGEGHYAFEIKDASVHKPYYTYDPNTYYIEIFVSKNAGTQTLFSTIVAENITKATKVSVVELDPTYYPPSPDGGDGSGSDSASTAKTFDDLVVLAGMLAVSALTVTVIVVLFLSKRNREKREN